MTHEPFELMHISELLRQREPTVQWIVAGIVPKGGITFIVAKSGTGKCQNRRENGVQTTLVRTTGPARFRMGN